MFNGDYHDFNQCLKASQNPEVRAWLETVAYPQLFPGCKTKAAYDDRKAQERGVDRQVTWGLSEFWTEEKIRSRYWGDFLAEFMSSDTKRTRGWALKKSDALYHVIACPREGRGLIAHWPSFVEAFGRHGDRWTDLAGKHLGGFRYTEAKNDGYTTWSLVVPLSELRKLKVDFREFNYASTLTPEPANRRHMPVPPPDPGQPQLGLF